MTEDTTRSGTPAAEARLAEADAIHDEKPEVALAILRDVAPAHLPAARRPRLAFLLNHLLGEKLHRWNEALAAQQALLDTGACPDEAVMAPLWRQAAVAAHLAGDVARANDWRQALAACLGATIVETQLLIALAAASFVAPGADAAEAGQLASLALRPIAERDEIAPGLEAALAAAASNLASALAERPLADLGDPGLRDALDLGARIALRFWERAGQWVQRERAHYLCALAANALGDGARGAAQARAALDLLDAHDAAHAEDVDRAFIEQELAQGLGRVGAEPAQAAQALDRAQMLAAAFEYPALRTWFADRTRRNAELTTHYGRA